jgi:cephalosporin hydroxylase
LNEDFLNLLLVRLRSRVRRPIRNLLASRHFAASVAEFQRLLPKEVRPQKLWDLTRTYRGRGWFRDLSAWQVESEYCQLVEFVAQQRPRVILEIGTAKGGTLLAWSRIAIELVISIDMFGGIGGGGYPKAKEKLFRQFAIDRPGVEIVPLRLDSHSLETRERVEETLAQRTIDFLFIDGDHTYAGVKRDFEIWSELVTPGGHVAFHDILRAPEGSECEVDRFWAELKQKYPRNFEFVENPRKAWDGVGVLQMPSHPLPKN